MHAVGACEDARSHGLPPFHWISVMHLVKSQTLLSLIKYIEENIFKYTIMFQNKSENNCIFSMMYIISVQSHNTKFFVLWNT